jgi:hypothetical protein
MPSNAGTGPSPHRNGRQHVKCFCTDGLEARASGCGEDSPEYEDWKRAFPHLEGQARLHEIAEALAAATPRGA